MNTSTSPNSLQWAFEKLAQAQGVAVDPLRLQSSLQHLPAAAEPLAQLQVVCNRMGLGDPSVLERPDRAQLPLIAHHDRLGWCVLVDQDALGRWTAATASETLNLPEAEWLRRSAIVPLAVNPQAQTLQGQAQIKESFDRQVSRT